MELSIGGPFYPGIEITYIAWDPTTYNNKGFRINPNLKPGDITKHMAIPWQADFLACANEWWPTARPDDIIPDNLVNSTAREKWARKSNGSQFQNYMDMVNDWSKLGFVKPKKINDETFFVEMERNL